MSCLSPGQIFSTKGYYVFNRFVFASKDTWLSASTPQVLLHYKEIKLIAAELSTRLTIPWHELTVLILIMYTVYLAVWEDLKVKPDAYIAVQPPHSSGALQIVILPVSLWFLSRDSQHGPGEEGLPLLLQ